MYSIHDELPPTSEAEVGGMFCLKRLSSSEATAATSSSTTVVTVLPKNAEPATSAASTRTPVTPHSSVDLHEEKRQRKCDSIRRSKTLQHPGSEVSRRFDVTRSKSENHSNDLDLEVMVRGPQVASVSSKGKLAISRDTIEF